jgi:hypothetical protein
LPWGKHIQFLFCPLNLGFGFLGFLQMFLVFYSKTPPFFGWNKFPFPPSIHRKCHCLVGILNYFYRGILFALNLILNNTLQIFGCIIQISHNKIPRIKPKTWLTLTHFNFIS